MINDYLIKKLFWIFSKAPWLMLVVIIQIVYQLLLCLIDFKIIDNMLVARFLFGLIIGILSLGLSISIGDKIGIYCEKKLKDEKNN
jgi:hypothetical protein